MNITSIDDLKAIAQGEVVELPPFYGGQPFVVRMRRPSLMVLIKSGKIPNSLLATANQLFTSSTDKNSLDKNPECFGEVLGVLDIIVEAAMIEPSLQQIKDSGVELTDEQYMAIFNYTQKGIEALKPFRGKQENTVSGVNG